MGFESDFHKVNRQFNDMMQPLEEDSRQQARDAYQPESRPEPEFSRWRDKHILPPGHIAYQGDFNDQSDKDTR